MPSHTHDWLHGWEQDDSGYGGSYNEFTWAGGSFPGWQVIGSTGGNGAHNTLPPYLTLYYIIKY
jgi:microcystin-dependent protein